MSLLQVVDAMYQRQPPLVGYRIPKRRMVVVTEFSDLEESDGSEDDSCLCGEYLCQDQGSVLLNEPWLTWFQQTYCLQARWVSDRF